MGVEQGGGFPEEPKDESVVENSQEIAEEEFDLDRFEKELTPEKAMEVTKDVIDMVRFYRDVVKRSEDIYGDDIKRGIEDREKGKGTAVTSLLDHMKEARVENEKRQLKNYEDLLR
jgi:hypothetical protein